MKYIKLQLSLLNLLTLFRIIVCNVESKLEIEGIVGGNVASIGQFKYSVSILRSGKHCCSGSIVGNYHVLTAGHCIIDEKNNFKNYVYTILASVINVEHEDSTGIKIEVEKAYVPREYNRINPTPENENYYETADIAVLKLKDSLDLDNNKFLSKLQLPEKYEYYLSYENEKPIVTGFGYEGMSYKINPHTNEIVEIPTTNIIRLKFAETIVFSNLLCAMNYQISISPQHLCAQVKQRSSDPEGVCMGDSGSPLVLNDNIVIAVLSSSPPGCNEKYKPAIYTRITSYLQFITQAMNDFYTPLMRVIVYNQQKY